MPAVAARASALTRLYDVDFESPAHIADVPVATSQTESPRAGPSGCLEPLPMVVQQTGILTGQSARFSGGQHSEMIFALGSANGGFPEQFPAYSFSMDLQFERLAGGFAVFLDGPLAHSVRFAYGEIHALTLDFIDPEPQSTLIGACPLGRPLTLAIDVNRMRQDWSLNINGQAVFSGSYPVPFLPAPYGEMQSMRLSLFGDGDVYADNIRIDGVPEPATLLLALATAVLLHRGRHMGGLLTRYSG